MYCINCGTENRDTDAFCRSCGQALTSPTPSPVVEKESAAAATPAPDAQETAAPAAGAAAAASAPAAASRVAQPPVQPAYQPPYAQAAQQGYAQGYQQGYAQPGYQPPQSYAGSYQPVAVPEGVLSAAWRDITSTAGWLKKVVFLCLLGCVPVLNFGVEGFALRWGRNLMFGKREPMPKEVFKKKEILTGFRALLIRIAYDCAYLILALLCVALLAAVFGLFGAGVAGGVTMLAIVLLCLFYAFFYYPVENAAIARMLAVDYLEGGLNFQIIWAAFRRSMGGIIAGSVVPPLAVGIIQGILMGIFSLVLAGAAQATIGSYSPYDMGYYGMDPSYMMEDFTSNLMYMGSGFIFVYVVLCLIGAMLNVFGMLIRWRAVFHWAARTAPEWKFESDEETFAAQAQNAASPDSQGVTL